MTGRGRREKGDGLEGEEGETAGNDGEGEEGNLAPTVITDF